MTVAAGHADHRARAIHPVPGRCAGDRSSAPAGRGGRTARRVPGLRLQPAPVARPAARRPDHPDVPAAVPGDVPDRRLPRPRRHREAGQRGPRPDPERRAGPPPRHGQAAAARRRRRRGRAVQRRPRPTRCSRSGRGARSCRSARRTPPEHSCGRCSTDPSSWPSSAASWPWTTGCSPSMGWAAASSRSCATRWICSSCSASPWSPPLSTSAGTRPAAAMGVRGPAWSASGST